RPWRDWRCNQRAPSLPVELNPNIPHKNHSLMPTCASTPSTMVPPCLRFLGQHSYITAPYRMACHRGYFERTGGGVVDFYFVKRRVTPPLRATSRGRIVAAWDGQRGDWLDRVSELLAAPRN